MLQERNERCLHEDEEVNMRESEQWRQSRWLSSRKKYSILLNTA